MPVHICTSTELWTEYFPGQHGEQRQAPFCPSSLLKKSHYTLSLYEACRHNQDETKYHVQWKLYTAIRAVPPFDRLGWLWWYFPEMLLKPIPYPTAKINFTHYCHIKYTF